MADIPLSFPNIGNALSQGAHAGYFAAETRQKADEEARRQAAQPFIQKAMQGDPTAMGQVASGDPKTAMVLATALSRIDAQKLAHIKGVADYTARSANAILQADPKDRPAIYQQMIEQGKAQGYDLSSMPSQYDPSVDARLRFHRAQSKEVNDFLLKQQEEQGRNARHNSPQATQTPSMEPMGGGGPVMAPAPAAMPGGPQRVSEVVPEAAQPQAAPVQTAQAVPPPGIAQGSMTAVNDPTGQSPGPLKPEATGVVGAPPPQQEQGAIWSTDPSLQGGQMMGHRAKPGAPLMPAEVAGHFVYRLPDGRTVLFKKPPERQLPPGYESDPVAPGRLRAIPGGPADKQGPEIDPTLRGDELLQSLDPAEAAQVRAVVEGRAQLPSLSARMAPEAKRLRQLAFQLDPNFDSTVYASRAATQKDMADGKLAVQRTSAEKLINHIGELHEQSAELNNSKTPLFNSVGNLIAANRGDPRITKFETTKHLVLEEADKYFSGTGGTTVSGMEEMKKLINNAQSPQQLQGAMEQLSKLMNGQLSAMAEQYNRGMRYTGDKAISPESLLSSQARATLTKIKENPIGGKPAAAITDLKKLYGLD